MMFTKASQKQDRGGIFAAPILFLSATFFILLAPFATAGEMARSADGKWLAIANATAYELVIFATDTMQIARRFDVSARDGTPSAIEGVYTDPTRRNFIITLQDAPEYWLISTDPNAPPVFEGFVHNNENGMTEGLASSEGLFALKRILLNAPVGDLVFAEDYRTATGLRPSKDTIVTLNLNVNREIGEVALIFSASEGP